MTLSETRGNPTNKIKLSFMIAARVLRGILSMIKQIILEAEMDHEAPQAQEWLSFFDEQVSPFYRADLMPPESEASSRAAIFFLDGYAFERAGRSSSYAPAAVDALEKNAPEFDGSRSPEVEKKIWIDFSKALTEADIPPNEKLCPLLPGDRSLVRQLREKGKSNILAYAQECIRQGIIPEAFDFLISIRGIGPKIASFFLRDAKELLPEGGVSVQIDGSIRWQLQPIDIWVKRTIELIARRRMENREAARFIVQNSANPERANMGMWYFSSLVCGSQYRHNSCLRAIPDARNRLEKFIRWKTEEYTKFQICSVRRQAA